MLKGVTIIQLKNADGTITEYTDTNMITNAAYNLMNIPPHMGIENTQRFNPRSLYNPIRKSVFGGIMLWSDHITEDANNIFPEAGPICLGHAGDNHSNDNNFRGTLNETESAELENGWKLVWDFATNQAVGTIRAVTLTSRNGGCLGFNGNSSKIVSSIVVNTTSALNASAVDTKFGTTEYFQSYINSTTATKLCGGVDTSYYPVGNFEQGVYTYAKCTKGATGITLRKIKYADKVGLKNSYPREDMGDVVINTTKKMCEPKYLFADENYLYSIYPYNVNKLDIVRIDCVNNTVVEEKTLTVQDATFTSSGSSYDYPYCAFYKGCYYVKKYNANDIYQISDSGVIQKTINPGIDKYRSALSVLGNHLCIYYFYDTNTSSNFSAYLYDGTNLQKTQLVSSPTYMGADFMKFVPSKFIKAPYVMVATYSDDNINYNGFRVGVHECFMSTINNLASDVVKTSVQTMKVTYTLTES